VDCPGGPCSAAKGGRFGESARYLPDPEALDFLQRILVGEVKESTAHNVLTFRTRFQQLTGPLMAKSVEDTLFFRQHMALALNEVGSEPLPRPYALAAFHEAMQTRRERQPDALSTTSTHDTKRGEDTRARLYTLTEAPEHWAQCVVRWREMNKSKVVLIDDGAAPRSGSKWMIYQALAGAWPVTLRPDDHKGLKALEARFLPYVEKALREEKLRTSWVTPMTPTNRRCSAMSLICSRRKTSRFWSISTAPCNLLFAPDW
jgi:(1->4)-alpha-D-glucan 1-alpha-D-glucosylmutase